ncbi:pentatricopeptide repeat-containing protein At3g59040 isoform X2 [Impatiens glandulifera]|uniref:pentatricopeptide repeat-containing protein At3g59040 isoform X2 n=1 Tax=Impatiens glandulifera TaxID=253017 RepID=UPI001FB080EC|nr:pentatricopeptide repeat-containing protein At3g59040 isoform X2 [Impatiens glandulifera]
MSQTLLFLKPSAPSTANWRPKICEGLVGINVSICRRRAEIVCLGMLTPRKFMQRRKKVENFKDADDEADQKNWRKLMTEIEETGSAVSVLRTQRIRNEPLPKNLVLGTLIRFKQLRKWNLVSEILEWLRQQHWWDFNEMDLLMLITAYGKLGDFNKAENVLSYMNKKGYKPSVISYTALMEAYGKSRKFNQAEAIFRRMQTSGPEPSAFTYQIILKTFVEADKFKEAEETFDTLLSMDTPLKPDQKMFHMIIYMHGKAGNFEKSRKVFSMMSERGVPKSTVTFNSLMSFETNYKEVARIYDEMQRAGFAPDVVSYSQLISAYGKARREDEALAVFEEMLDAGVRPTQKSYNILLDAFAISGMIEPARTVFKSMRRDRCTPDLCSYTTMLSAYVNASDMEGAEKFFIRIKVDGLEPNVVTYGVLIKGYAKINDVDKMMEKYEQMLAGGIKANETVLTTIMDAYGKNRDFDSAVIWFKEMKSCGILPDQKTKNVLLSLAKSVEEQMEANQLLGEYEHLAGEEKICGLSKLSNVNHANSDNEDSDEIDSEDSDDIDSEDSDDIDSEDIDSEDSDEEKEDEVVKSDGRIELDSFLQQTVSLVEL